MGVALDVQHPRECRACQVVPRLALSGCGIAGTGFGMTRESRLTRPLPLARPVWSSPPCSTSAVTGVVVYAGRSAAPVTRQDNGGEPRDGHLTALHCVGAPIVPPTPLFPMQGQKGGGIPPSLTQRP